ncbi:MAG: formate dehydrogenase subunit delta [Alphaproteobacteria bacterium]|nr:formate dehydrogenase subunit delta [Alphaproteobacteria bacterium]
MDEATLVRMANQIAAFFATEGATAAVDGIAGHIRSFWNPRMRRAFCRVVKAGGEGLSPLALEAGRRLASEDAAHRPA